MDSLVKKIGLDEQPSKKFTKLEIRRIATDWPCDLLKEEPRDSTVTC